MSAVGKMREILWWEGVFRGAAGGVALKVGKMVPFSQFSPTEATEETWMIICGIGEGSGDCATVDGMRRRMFLRPGQPQRIEVSGSTLWGCWRPGTLAISAPRTVLKSYCWSWVIRACSFDGP